MYFNNCGNSSINTTFILEPMSITGGTPVVSACTAVYTNELISCDGDATIQLSTGETIFNTSIMPDIDGGIDVGSPLRRFREINTYSGTSTYWTATTSVTTPMLDLGLDSLGNPRQITADSSVIQNDTLFGGTY
jgi:hypothetical protein